MKIKNKAVREELANRLSFLFGQHPNIGMAIDFIEQFLDEQLEKRSKRKTVKIGEENYAGKDEVWCDWFACPSCGDTFITVPSNFCGNCGVKLCWITQNKK